MNLDAKTDVGKTLTPEQDASNRLRNEFLMDQDASKFLAKNFSQLDRNHDQRITSEELYLFKSTDPNELKSRDYVRRHFDNIVTRSIDDWFLETAISKNDLTQLEIKSDPKYASRQQSLERMRATFERDFDKLDSDKDHVLEKKELEEAAANPALDDGEKQLVEFLRQGFSTFRSHTYRRNEISRGYEITDLEPLEDVYNFDRSAEAARKAGFHAIPLSGILTGVPAYFGFQVGRSIEVADVLARAFNVGGVAVTISPVGALVASGILVGGAAIMYETTRELSLQRDNEKRAQMWTAFDAIDANTQTTPGGLNR